MNTTLYYFSSTGNSLYAAKTIQGEIGGELINIAKNPNTVCNSKSIGIVFPLFYFGLPHIVVTFLEKLTITENNPYLFAVATCGDDLFAKPMVQLNNILKQKGLTLSYGKLIKYVTNYIITYPINTRKMHKLLQNAHTRTLAISKEIKNHAETKTGKRAIISQLVYRIYERMRAKSDTHFSISGNCTGCGTCAAICPVKNITMENAKPAFSHNCEHCISCLHICPQQAIEYKHKTHNKLRYRNPNISIQELLN